MTIRLAKFLSDSGVASRRASEDLIKSGVVSVNGEIVNTPVFFVNGDEKICVNGKEIKQDSEIKLYMFNKPINTMTTACDPEHRKTIYDVLDKKYKNLKYIGRLDFKTTGLLLLTNNGEFARQMSLPKNRIPRTYIATVDKVEEKKLNVVKRGVVVDGIKYRPMKIEVLDEHNLKLTLEEGKKNEIRIVLKHIGLPVKALHRISYGPVLLGNLGCGKISEIDKKTIDLMIKNVLK
nr:rRNA pseudouridine synthase [Candidatus Enterousia merdequi]